jgi:hypothetical protein
LIGISGGGSSRRLRSIKDCRARGRRSVAEHSELHTHRENVEFYNTDVETREQANERAF